LYFFAKHGKINLNFLEKQCSGIGAYSGRFVNRPYETAIEFVGAIHESPVQALLFTKTNLKTRSEAT
jgi:hypothetical protein